VASLGVCGWGMRKMGMSRSGPVMVMWATRVLRWLPLGPRCSAQLTGITLRLSRDALAVAPSVMGIVRYLLGRLVLERGQSVNALVTVLARRHARSVLDAADGLHRDRTA